MNYFYNDSEKEINNKLKANKLSFATLLKETKGYKWSPKPVEEYGSLISIDIEVESGYATYKNIVYNLAYLEYLQKQFDELSFTNEIIEKMLFKNYIIVALSIIEALFENLLRKDNAWHTYDWKKISSINKDACNGQDIIRTTTIVSKKEINLKKNIEFSDMINRIRSLPQYQFYNESDFKELSILRKKRNSVHLTNQKAGRTDYYTFNFAEKDKSRNLLLKLLMSNEFNANKEKSIKYYDFLIGPPEPIRSSKGQIVAYRYYDNTIIFIDKEKTK